MAIKYSSLKTSGITINNADKYINISGGWDSAPVNGGIITFNGKASEVTDNPPNLTTSTINFGSDLGTYYITSLSTDTYLGYKKTNYNFTCILGYLSKTRASIPLGSCIYKDSTLNDVLSSIKKYLGIDFSLPRGGTLKLHEPVWLKEDQELVSLLNEILVATGCILYSEKGDKLKCKTIKDFYTGLSGTSNNNTISKNFVVDRGGTDIKYIDISGTKQIIEDLKSKETSDKTVNGKKITTTIERTIPDIKVGGKREIITTVEDEVNFTKTITIEKYEDAPGYNKSNNFSAPIKECFPYDPARILERKVEIFLKAGIHEARNVNACVKEYVNSCNLKEKDKPTFFYSAPPYVIIEEILETWEYNTNEEEIVTNPDNYIPKAEKVLYQKEIKRNLAYDNINNCNLTYGNTFDFLENYDDAKDFAQQFFTSHCVDIYQGLELVEKEIIEWNKRLGSYRWEGTRTLQEAIIRTRFEQRKAYIKELKKALDGGYDDYEQLDSDYVDDAINDTDPTYIIQDPSGWDYNTFKTNYGLLITNLESSKAVLETVSEETRVDWEPQFSTAPAPYKIYNIPWQDREDFTQGGLAGESVTLQVGRFNDYTTAKTVAKEIKEAKEQRKKSLSITNINELFAVGTIDAPSFNIDVDGIKSSGVYLNG